MKYIPIILSKGPRALWTLPLISLLLLLVQEASAGDLEICIKNRGDIPVRVAMMEDGASLLGYGKSVEGWWEIKPSGWRNPLFRRVRSGPTYYLAFAIQDDNGRWGAVNYQPGRNTDFVFKSNKRFVVDKTFKEFKKKAHSASELNQPGGNFISIPFSWGVADFYSYSDDGTIQINIDINPSRIDPITVYLDGNPRSSTGSRGQASSSKPGNEQDQVDEPDPQTPLAMYYTAYSYAYGVGVPEDKIKAVKWYKRAAELGHAPSQYALGVRYDRGEGIHMDKELAIIWYRKSAAQGYSIAIERLKELEN